MCATLPTYLKEKVYGWHFQTYLCNSASFFSNSFCCCCNLFTLKLKNILFHLLRIHLHTLYTVFACTFIWHFLLWEFSG